MVNNIPNMMGNNIPKGQYPNVNGIAPRFVLLVNETSSRSTDRDVLRRGWNGNYARGMINGRKPAIGGFRAVNNAGDYLARRNYSCGGGTQVNASTPGLGRLIGGIKNSCDGSNIPPSTCNVKYVYDSSDYTKYRKLKAKNRNYSDYTFGGDKNNGSYVALQHVRH